MKKSLFATTLAIAVGFAAPLEAQFRPWEISIAGGPSLARGDLGDVAETGYHVQASVGFDLPLLPFGLRADAFWQEFPDAGDDWYRQIGGLVNATVGVPLILAEPYLLAGVGYLRTDRPDPFMDAENSVGFNAGAGVEFPFVGLSGFAEARYLNLFGGDDSTSYQSIPITVGIRF